MRFQRYAGNPILAPHPDHPWEDLAVFNPAAWYDEEAGEVLLLYRAGESHREYKCFFGLAKSRDGYNFERVSDQPVLSPSEDGWDASTIQDPRMVKIGDWYYITYAARHFPFGQFWVRDAVRYRWPESPAKFPCYLRKNATLTGLALTRDFQTWIRAGVLTDPLLDDRDVILFPEKVGGKFVMMHRPLEWCAEEFDAVGCVGGAVQRTANDGMAGGRGSNEKHGVVLIVVRSAVAVAPIIGAHARGIQIEA